MTNAEYLDRWLTANRNMGGRGDSFLEAETVRRIADEMLDELQRADAQHSDPRDLYEMLAVLGEEFGELQQAALDYDYRRGGRAAMIAEAIQVGAMAIKVVRLIGRSDDKRRGDDAPTTAGDTGRL